MRTQTLTKWSRETGLPVSAMRQAIRRGHLRARRLSPSQTAPYYITERDLNDWLESRLIGRPAW